MIIGREEGSLKRCRGATRSGKPRRAYPLGVRYDDEDVDANMLVQQNRRLDRRRFRVRAGRARLVGLQASCDCPPDNFSFIAGVAVRTRAGKKALPAMVKRFWVIDPFEGDN